MSKQDDEHWLDILAGKNVPEANPKTLHEAQTLREALQAENRLQQLVARLETEGYIVSETTTVATKIKPLQWNWDSIFFWAVPAMAVIVVAIMIVPHVWQTPLPEEFIDPEEFIEKSEPSSTPKPSLPLPTSGPAQILKESDSSPQEFIMDLKEQFIPAGANVQVSQLGEQFQVDIKIPETPSEDLQELCGNYGIDLERAMSSTRLVRFIVSPE